MRLVAEADPLSPAVVAARRVAVLDLISAALLQKPQPSPRGGRK
jgi:hypothetical protein